MGMTCSTIEKEDDCIYNIVGKARRKETSRENKT
jgi:hypothetical protein